MLNEIYFGVSDIYWPYWHLLTFNSDIHLVINFITKLHMSKSILYIVVLVYIYLNVLNSEDE